MYGAILRIGNVLLTRNYTLLLMYFWVACKAFSNMTQYDHTGPLIFVHVAIIVLQHSMQAESGIWMDGRQL